jgi:hypothetical protein
VRVHRSKQEGLALSISDQMYQRGPLFLSKRGWGVGIFEESSVEMWIFMTHWTLHAQKRIFFAQTIHLGLFKHFMRLAQFLG